jgi:hypothetical protein
MTLEHSRPLTPMNGQLMLFAVASHAKTSAMPEGDGGSTARSPVFGQKCDASLAPSAPVLSVSKILRTGDGIGCVVCGPICESSVIEPLRPSRSLPGMLEPITSGGDVLFLPTPVADDTGWRKKPYAQGGRALSFVLGGPTNPEYVEWMMGFPIGWSAVDASGVLSSPKSPNGSDAD